MCAALRPLFTVKSLLGIVLLAAVFCAAIVSLAQTTTTLHTFSGSPIDGADPQAALIRGNDGNFYGTTSNGGANTANPCSAGSLVGCGTVFKITPDGSLTTLYSFCSQANCTDGANPYGRLVQGTDGNFYGTTFQGGGVNHCGGIIGCGTVFKMTPAGALTTLYTFCARANCVDGEFPYAGVVQATDGNFYGTTWAGGVGNPTGGGTAFRITPAGALTTLVSFCNLIPCVNGVEPYAGLIQASDGNFYGTTITGGVNGEGTVFRLTPTGTLTTIYSFCALPDCADGHSPYAGLVQASDGNLYGTTVSGGAIPGGSVWGTVFKITLSGTLTTLYSFCSRTGCPEGTQPLADLVQGQDGSLYGTTTSAATVFSITLGGWVTTLHSFNQNYDTVAGLAQGTDGKFYGTIGSDAESGLGMVFSISAPGKAQFVQMTPCRLVDTRQGSPIQGGTVATFNLMQVGNCNIPSAAVAYSLNVTVVPHGPLGYLSIWPTGEGQPVVSTLNSPDGRVKANAAIVPAGDHGPVSVYVTDTTDLVLDIDGYFTAPGSETLQFYPLTPCRLVDTRDPFGPLGGPRLPARQERDFPFLMSNCIPLGLNPVAYSLNFTAVPNPSNQPLGYLTVWPMGEPQPLVSTLNNPTATDVANAAIVPSGQSGEVAVFANDTTDLVIDINGYFGAPGQGGYSFYPAAPCRAFDSRNNNGQPFSGERMVNIVGSPCSPPSNAAAYVFNATVVPTGVLGYLTLWPDGENRPVVSTLNALDGAITSNMAIVPTSNGYIDAYASGVTQLILDISGYFAP